jgi:hypothetical protein
MRVRILLLFTLFLISVNSAWAQATAFTYQGKLSESGLPANGSYEFEFKLFDALTAGTQIGPTVTREEVMVTDGIFTVQLDFGAAPLNGDSRFLEISVRPSDGPAGATLTPRQQITTAPYAIKSLNAASADGLSVACVSCVTSNQIASVHGSALSGSIPVASVPAGSGNYVQNSTLLQASSNFNIDGNGTVGGTLSGNVVNATSQYNILGFRLLSIAGTANIFAGINSGTMNTGSNNSFFGAAAGAGNTTGTRNAFFGTQAGATNANGANNAFFGYRAGFENLSNNNSFFGSGAGDSTTTGANNAFFGAEAGAANTTAAGNSFFGYRAGFVNTAGGNSFFGNFAGASNTTAANNSFFGNNTGISNQTGENNSFFGSNVGGSNTSGSNNAFFGSNAGVSNVTGSANSFFGKDAGMSNTANSNSFFGAGAGTSNTTGGTNAFFGSGAGRSNTTGGANSFFGFSSGEDNDTAVDNSFFGHRSGANTISGSRNSFFGYNAGSDNRLGQENSFFGTDAGSGNALGNGNSFFGYLAGRTNTVGNNNTIIGSHADVGPTLPGVGIVFATAIGANAVVNDSHSIVLGTSFETVHIPGLLISENGLRLESGLFVSNHSDATFSGNVILDLLGTAGSTALCKNSSNQIATCSSSLRYKTSVRSFSGGLDIVRRLRPIAFDWKDGGMRDVGFGAEEVERVEPLLTTRNSKGEIEGVKYAQITTVLVNAIQQQQQTIEQQQQQIDALKKLVCLSNPHCK